MIKALFRYALLACAPALAAPVAAWAQAVPPAAAPAAPTAEDFGAQPSLTDPILAPDGRRVAARAVLEGKQVVMVIDLSRPGRPVSKMTIPEKSRIEWLRWAGSDRLLVSLSRVDKIMEREFRITRVSTFDLKTGKQMFLSISDHAIDGDDVIFVDPAGDFALLSVERNLVEYPSVYRIDLTTGKYRAIVAQRDQIWTWYADSAGVVRAGIGNNDGKWWMLYRSRDGDSFRRLESHKGGKDDNHLQQVIPVAGSDKGYAVADGKNGHLALYRYDFAADALGELLYENPAVDVDDYEIGKTGNLLGVRYTADRPEMAWFDPEYQALQKRIDRALPGAINHIVSVSADKKLLLIWTGSASDPGAYYLFNRADNTMDVLAETHRALSGKRLAPMEPVRYAARDGLEIPGYLTLPVGRGSKALPLIVMPHGGPFARDSWGYDPWVQYLASRGYAVLQPNFRGSTGFGQSFVERGVGQWGRGMQDDIDDGVKWLAARGTIDPKRVCIMGGSFGGYAAMWAAVRNPELYRCAISMAGVSDMNAMLLYSRQTLSAPRYFRDWRDRVKGDRNFELDQISPIKSVEKMTVPILIAHGADDDTVPVAQSRRLHDALQKLGRPHEYIVYPKEGHGFTNPVNSTDFLKRVGAFLDKYNPPN
jgi:dipeptidyl aminopeptidase/acylaminoacyl peptidase